MSRPTLFLLLALLCGCGARSGLGFLGASDESGRGGSGAFQIGVAGAVVVHGAGTTGDGGNGKPSFGGARPVPGGGTTGSPGGAVLADGGAQAAGGTHAGGAAGSPVLVDDPMTLGDDRPGWVQCRGSYDAAGNQITVSCPSPKICCDRTATCVSDASQCSGTNVSNCDGNEDCPAAQSCCVGQCASKCTNRKIHHIACGGPCGDADGDWIPDAVDTCIISQFEDGNGPFPEDGCSDYDGDGVRDGLDKCPKEMENGLPPKPDDGCL